MFDMFSTREISIAIWMAIFIPVALLYKPTRKCVIDILKTACSVQLFIPFLLMIGYAIGITCLFSQTQLWRPLFIKNIAIWVIFVGTPLLFGALNKKAEEHYLKKDMQNNFKLTVLVEFLVSTFTLPLIWEMLLIPIMIFLFMLDTVAATDSQYRPAKKLIGIVIIAINIVFVIETIFVSIKSFNAIDKNTALINLFIPIAFSLLYVPTSYLFAVFGKYQMVFNLMGFKESKCDFNFKLIHRFKIVWSCGLSLMRIEQFEKDYIQNMFDNMYETDFENLVHDFRTGCSDKNPSTQNKNVNENKIVDEIKESNFQKTIHYISKHIGMFTLFATFCVGILSVIIKGFFYAFMCGKFDYWGIDHSHINITNENALYEIVILAAIAVVFIAFNFIPFSILISKSTWYVKLLKIILMFFVTSFILACIFLIGSFLANKISLVEIFKVPITTGLYILLELTIQLIPLTLITYLLGLAMPIPFLRQKNKTNSRILIHKFFNGCTIFSMLLGLALYIILAYGYGKRLASEQKTFKTIGKYSVVIYEDEEHYIVSDCTSIEDQITIDNAKQKLISKESVETITITFKVVKQKD